jgi:hypothetical protein
MEAPNLDFLEPLLKIFIVVLAILTPLAIWKFFEVLFYLFNHIHFS